MHCCLGCSIAWSVSHLHSVLFASSMLLKDICQGHVSSEHSFWQVASHVESEANSTSGLVQAPERPSSPGLEVPTPAAFVCTVSDRVTARLDVPRCDMGACWPSQTLRWGHPGVRTVVMTSECGST